jgi:RNA polymerase sigma-70 factor (ECF subfamily)
MIQPNPDMSYAGAAPSSQAGRAAALGEKAELIQLIASANRGDSAAQAELVRRYTRRIAGFIRGIIRQPDAVEDVTQIVLIKMFRRMGRLRDPGLFESWLFTLARNTCLDFLRRRSCRPATVAIDEQVNQIADPGTGNATGEILAALDRALTRLSPIDRSLVSQFVAGESYGAIANRTGLSLATVKVRLHRVRPFLRSWVGEMTDTRLPGGKGWRATAGSRASTPAACPAAA